LDISMLESGSIEPDKRDFMISDLLDRLLTANLPQAQQKNITLTASETNSLVHTDPVLLERIVENYISNAIRYTDNGTVEIDCVEKGEHLSVTVTDTGSGIPSDKIERVFDEYYQLDNSVRDRSKGLGLGLSIVRHLANLLGLSVSANSELGKGSTFEVEVPLSKTTKPIGSKTNSLDAKSVEPTESVVLIVDDDVVIIDAMAEVLSIHDIHVETAENGDQALDCINLGVKPDMVISDYRMPGMTGLEVMKEVRRVLNEEVPFVIMTGDTSFDKVEGIEFANCTILRKPIDMPELVALIESIT